MENWFAVSNEDEIFTPTLAVYKDRIHKNIDRLIESVDGDLSRLCPHVKTHKISELTQLMLEKGITQFKCSTIAEAEMLGICKAPFVLMAYQPVGPNQLRWLNLIDKYPNTKFSCLVDHVDVLKSLNLLGKTKGKIFSVFIDVNIGMGRTGLTDVSNVKKELTQCFHIKLEGLHGYDGHIHDSDLDIRISQSDLSYSILKRLAENFERNLKLIIGGSPSFSVHRNRKDVICSPGTFVFWDWGYREKIPDQKFEFAALLLTRVISIIDSTHICVDLGYKAVASENPLPRVLFLNAPNSKQIMQSEEHLVLEVENTLDYPIGKVLYAVPRHICPTVALFDTVEVIQDHTKVGSWNVIAGNRKITI